MVSKGIDPWEDYEDYDEYRGQQQNTYNCFLNNIENSGQKEKIVICRGYSNKEIPKFKDEFFDIIYIPLGTVSSKNRR